MGAGAAQSLQGPTAQAAISENSKTKFHALNLRAAILLRPGFIIGSVRNPLHLMCSCQHAVRLLATLRGRCWLCPSPCPSAGSRECLVLTCPLSQPTAETSPTAAAQLGVGNGCDRSAAHPPHSRHQPLGIQPAKSSSLPSGAADWEPLVSCPTLVLLAAVAGSCMKKQEFLRPRAVGTLTPSAWMVLLVHYTSLPHALPSCFSCSHGYFDGCFFVR